MKKLILLSLSFFMTFSFLIAQTDTTINGVNYTVFSPGLWVEVEDPEELLEIGMEYQGGIIAYILQPGDPGYDSDQTHGLIAAPNDHISSIAWANNFTATGATGTALGTGQANTTAIVNAHGGGSYAAKLCDDLVLGGYEDWYLPSKDELNKLYENRVAVGGFAIAFYWSSSEVDTLFAWVQGFSDGFSFFEDKVSILRVRAVRAF
nr:DUF1566 domain-containing protein [Saprospiraceae bacterium]